jgi:hypothetical protein
LRAVPVLADVGNVQAALPAADRVLTPVTDAAPLAVATTAGYGVIESQAGEGAHHRLAGSLAAALGFGHHLALSLAFDGRYDRHPAGDTSAVGTPQLTLVGGVDVGSGLRLGANLGLRVAGRTAPSLDVNAAALTAQGLASWALRRGVSVAAMAGFRLDQTASAAPNLMALSNADRLSLGLSAFDAVPFGVAVFQRLRRHVLFGEFSGEWLVGKGAPAALRSPLRAAVGGRLHVSESFSGELLLELGLSRRPSYTTIEALIPVEPRFGVSLGVRYAPGPAPAAASVTSPAPPKGPAPVVAARNTRLRGFVFDPDGVRVEGVRVTIDVAGVGQQVESGPDGEYLFETLPLGRAIVTLEGPGLVTTRQELELTQSDMLLPLQAARQEPRAQLRGLVRSFAGVPLAAVVRVPDVGQTVVADKAGRFMLELRAGDYEVQIECAGYLTQRRKISVQDNGVTLLNVELHEAPH